MRESVSKEKAPSQTTGDSNLAFVIAQVDKEKEKGEVIAYISNDIGAVILDVSLQRMHKKSVAYGTTASVETLELWSDEFDGKSDFGPYRLRLELALMESMQVGLETIVSAVFDGSADFSCAFESKFRSHGILKGLDPSAKSARHVRLQVCSSFIRIA